MIMAQPRHDRLKSHPPIVGILLAPERLRPLYGQRLTGKRDDTVPLIQKQRLQLRRAEINA